MCVCVCVCVCVEAHRIVVKGTTASVSVVGDQVQLYTTYINARTHTYSKWLQICSAQLYAPFLIGDINVQKE